MRDDRRYDWYNQWGVGGELSQKEHYYHYYYSLRNLPIERNSAAHYHKLKSPI